LFCSTDSSLLLKSQSTFSTLIHNVRINKRRCSTAAGNNIQPAESQSRRVRHGAGNSFFFIVNSPQRLPIQSTQHRFFVQLNSQRFISFDAVMALPSIAALTTDRELVVAAASASSQFTLDESKSSMKPVNLKVERTTLILRDIPSAAPADDVKVLFQGLASAPVSLNADVGDNWFVTFASEDACLAAAMHLRSQTFAGKPVQARVKSENFLSAYKPVTARPSQFAAPFVPYYYDPNFYAQQQTPASPTKGGRVKQQPSPKSRRGEQSPQQPQQQQQQQQRPASKARGSASSVAASIAASGAAATPDVQASGYSHPFTRYSREQMASIVRHTISTGANTRPATLTFGQSPAARNQPQADTQLLAPVPLYVCLSEIRRVL
jgi:hypothetical protein